MRFVDYYTTRAGGMQANNYGAVVAPPAFVKS